MAMKVSLSFKDSEKNMYEYLMKQLSPSIYIKGLIKKEMQDQDSEKPKKKNLLDF